MKLLALDSATEISTVALEIDGYIITRDVTGKRHAEVLLAQIESVLHEGAIDLSALDAIAFGRGPGMFTGLRIGIGVVQGLSMAADIRVIPVSSLAIQAQGAKEDYVLSAFDARISQVYWACYARNHKGVVEPLTPERVTNPEDVSLSEDNLSGLSFHAVGSGFGQYEDKLRAALAERLLSVDGEAVPRAVDLLALAANEYRKGLLVEPEQALPVYVRNKVAHRPAS